MNPAHRTVVLLLCLLLLVSRGLGLHVHIPSLAASGADGGGAHRHDGDAHTDQGRHAAGDRRSHIDLLTTDLLPEHMASHLTHGDLDINDGSKLTGKFGSGLVIAIVGTVLALLVLPLRRERFIVSRTASAWPRRWAHFIPLSHAPPRAA